MTATTKNDITRWFNEGKDAGNSHMIVAVDTFDHDDYPVYVPRGTDAKRRVDQINAAPMSRVKEVYSYSIPLEDQIDVRFANFN